MALTGLATDSELGNTYKNEKFIETSPRKGGTNYHV